MSENLSRGACSGFCIYIDTLFQGSVPVVSDGDDKYVVFEAELDAQK